MRDIKKSKKYSEMIKLLNSLEIDYYNFDDEQNSCEQTTLILGHRMSPVKLNIEIENKENSFIANLWFSIRANKFMFEGDTSDCTDLISNIITVLISIISEYRILLVDVEVPTGIDGEIYSKDLIILHSNYINADFESENFIEDLKYIIELSNLVIQLMCNIINLEPNCNDMVKIENEIYGENIRRVFGNEIDVTKCNYIKRKNEDWEWLYNSEEGISLFYFNKEIGYDLLELLMDNQITFISGVYKDIISFKKRLNTVSREKVSLAKRILKLYNQDNFEIIPIENKFFVISKNVIIVINDECDIESVQVEKNLIRERRKLENQILFSERRIEWSDKINPGRFEDLIQEILSKEMYISRVRKVGPTNQPDNGVDLIIEYIDINKENKYGVKPYEIKKIIGQCKAYGGTVGRKEVTGIRDTIEHYNVQGYWLFVSSQISVPLTEVLQKLRDSNSYDVNWWNRNDIEGILQSYPEITNKYEDILRIVI